MQHFEQFAHVLEMQAGGRFIEDVQRLAGRAAREFLRQLDALRLATGESRRRLANVDVAEADFVERYQLVADRRHGAEELGAFLDRHVEHVGDGLAAEGDVESLAVVALAVALVALNVDVGQKVHLDFDDAVALALLAAPALDVEREPARLVAARLSFRQSSEPIADRREGAGVGGRVRARRTADRALVDVDDLVEELEAIDAVMLGGLLATAVQAARERLVESFDDQCRLTAAGDAGDAGHHTQRNRDVEFFQVVATRATNGQLLILLRLTTHPRHRNRPAAGEIGGGDAALRLHHLLGRAGGDDFTAVDAGTDAHVDQVIGGANRFLVVFDDKNRVVEIAQTPQRIEQPRVVALMETDRRLIQHIENAGQTGSDLRSQSYTLRFATRQRRRAARQCQVIEADVDQEAETVADFLQDASRDLTAGRGQALGQLLEPGQRLLDRHLAHLADVDRADLDRKRFGLQTIAITGFARMRRLITRQLIAHPIGVGLAEAPFQTRDHPFERLGDLISLLVVFVFHGHGFGAGAIQK